MDNRYSDLGRPPLSAAQLTRAVRGGGLRWRGVAVVDETRSTNADLALAAAQGQAEGLVLIAEHQSGGRGRLDRQWRSPARAGLTMSMLLAPRWPRSAWGWVSLAAGVALVETARTDAGVADAVVKWPNDVLIDEQKCAGILAEVVTDSLVVLGVGLNVSTRLDELALDTATSLALSGAACTDRATLATAFLRHFDSVLALETAEVRARFIEVCSSLDASVAVDLPSGEVVRGRGVDVDHEGRLVVETGQDTRSFAVGDVRHLRRDS